MEAGSAVTWRSAGVRSTLTRAALTVMVGVAAIVALPSQSRAASGSDATAPVSSPGISAPPDIVVGEADGSVDLPVTLSAPGQSSVSVHYETVNVTAAGAGADPTPCPTFLYGAVSGTLTFPPGVTTQTVTVSLNDCGISGPAGFLSFDLALLSPSGGTIDRAVTEVDITGNDQTGATPALYARDAVTDSKAGTVSVPVVLGGPSGVASGSTVTVGYATHDASAAGGKDYAATSGTLTFPPGETAQNIMVPIKARAGAAPVRAFTVTLTSPHHATIARATAVVTIGASGKPAVSSPGISASPDVVTGEADGYVDVPVTLGAPGRASVSVIYETVNVTASGFGADSSPCPTFQYAGGSGTLTFPPGVTTRFVRVDLENCLLSGPAGFLSFDLALLSPSGGTIDRAVTEVDITGNDQTGATPALYARDAVTDSKAGTVSVPVVLGGPSGVASSAAVTVGYATHDASAAGGKDYAATSGTLTFPPGETAQNIMVPIKARAGAAPARAFTVTLTSPHHATIARATAVVTIGASGKPPMFSPAISVPSRVDVGEADGYVDVPVTLGAPGQTSVSVIYETVNGTASGFGADSSPCPTFQYAGGSGTLTFPPGVTTRFVRVDLENCLLSSPGDFTFDLLSPVNGVIANGVTSIRITQKPKVPGAPAKISVVAGDHQAKVSFAAPADGGDSVDLYTVTARPGGAKTSSASSPVTVTGLTNGTAYTFTVTAANGVGTGPASPASKAVIPGTAPTRPTAVNAVSGSTRTRTGPLTVTYKTPTSNGGPPITRYTARCTSSNGGAARTGTHAGPTAAPITVASVTTGKTYTCTVTAANAIGASPSSAKSRPVTAGAPAAPAKVAAVRVASGRLKVSFTPGAANGSPVTKYTASCRPARGGVSGTKSGPAGPLTVTGLTGGKSYTCTVTATNARGKGPASPASAAVGA